MFKLSRRLEKIAGLVPKNCRVADIGTDHGYLPIYLINNNIANYVLACDIAQKPLKSAESNISAHCAGNIELRLSDGLEKISPDEVDTVIIAGMGGEVISGIIDRCSWLKSDKYTLILQPTTSPEKLREYLYCGGFSTMKEIAVAENGKVYSIIKAKFGGKTKFTAANLYIGFLKNDNEDNLIYIKKQLERVSKLAKDLKEIPSKQAEYLLTLKVKEEIIEILGD